MTAEEPHSEAFQYLQSIGGELPPGPMRESILAQLRAAPSASLFILSRKAQSADVRCEAATILTARWHEDDASPEPAPFDAVSQRELPAELATHRHFYKFSEGERWVLTTRSGVKVAVFSSETELDQWWRGLKKQRGRILTGVRRGTASDVS
jgi:hypothetical protein